MTIYILQCPCVPAFGNQGLNNEIALGGNRVCLEQWGKFKYYIVIFDQLQGHSGELIQSLDKYSIRTKISHQRQTSDIVSPVSWINTLEL